METISSIVINIISSFLYDNINDWKEKKHIQKFKAEIAEWIQEFERKNDDTIITNDVFCRYIVNCKIIQKITQYVLATSDKEESEESFIKNIQKDFEKCKICLS